jgi:hypothetical protein
MANSLNQKVTPALSKEPAVKPEPTRTPRLDSHSTRVPSPHFDLRQSLSKHNESDPTRCTLELIQRGRLILDVSTADLEASEAAAGALHPTTWHFRHGLNEAQRSWKRLQAEIDAKVIETALELPPLTVLLLSEPTPTRSEVVVILIDGQTYRPERVKGTELAPIQWRLTRLRPPLENGPYYVCRLADGSTQCDCANWTYRIAETERSKTSCCKHLEALDSLGWI